MDDMEVGNIVKGIVTGIEKYGIFVRLNDEYSGLIHISEITHRFVKNINNFATLGEEIYVEIKSIDRDNKKCVLSIKELNYRIKNTNPVKESVRGFYPLKNQLPIWIDEKYNELSKNKKNN